MKRSIPLRGSVGAIDTNKLYGLTEGQLAALEQIQAWEEANRHERELLYLDSVLETEDRLQAAKMLRRLSEGSRTSGLWCFFASIATGIERGDSLVGVLREAKESHEAERGQK